MFGFDQFVALNRRLAGIWRLAGLNLLWTAVAVAGLGVLGVGPASYAMAKYLHRWFRHGETPPLVPTVLRYAREQFRQSVLLGTALLLAGGIVLVNLLSLSDWYLRLANLLALAVLWIITAHVFTVLAALDVQGLRSQLVSALLLGLGSLHWTILGTTAVVIGYALMLRFAVPLLAMFGVVLPAAVFAAICSRILRDLEPPEAEDPRAAPRPPAHPATRIVARSRRTTSVPDSVRPLTKGTPA